MNGTERPHVTAERPLDGAWLSFDLPVVLKQIKAEERWRSGIRNAMTLIKSRGQRIRFALRPTVHWLIDPIVRMFAPETISSCS